ncbi:unnamed protein product [Acanthoscelides obtectus]|uniref:Phosducin domain-containing protein n=1 Tax=Acanthoscelides obtectus TaxID=200917 RepID=A0A9P0KS01_ACAOB|nr:unnamed protein product [Acanthoscelides obtectus]CAK1676246.1 Phosducin-like protein [Acanthoscelides obtectus]
MATLEDKILGEKLHNYCSSSEESGGENSDCEGEGAKQPEAAEPSSLNKWEGTSTNTGPKGVIRDFKDYKQLESEKRRNEERQMIELAKKFTMTVKSTLEEEREKAALEDPELAELLKDDFLLQYQKKRMQEMLEQTNHNIKFGSLLTLTTGQEFLDAIDKEHKSVTVIIHIYDDNLEACRALNASLQELCRIYENVKFCRMPSNCAGVSREFKREGLPALLVYKDGNLVGNFVRLTDDLGNDFSVEEVKIYLVEHGSLEDKSLTPALIKNASESSDSD